MAFTDEGALVLLEDHDRFLFMLFMISMWFHTREQRGVPSFSEALTLVITSDYWDGPEMADVMEFLVHAKSCAGPTDEDVAKIREPHGRFELELA